MINLIWVGLVIISIMFALVTGNLKALNEAIFKGAEEAVTICIGFISILTFWLGIMNIAEKAGLLTRLSALFSPFVKRLFPDLPKDHPVIGYIVSNIVANLFGLGNAATPMGIKAMEEMRKINHDRSEASRSMITFLAINTSSVTLIPTTVLAIRMKYQSSSPEEIVGTTLIASMIGCIFALLIDRYFYYRRTRKRR